MRPRTSGALGAAAGTTILISRSGYWSGPAAAAGVASNSPIPAIGAVRIAAKSQFGRELTGRMASSSIVGEVIARGGATSSSHQEDARTLHRALLERSRLRLGRASFLYTSHWRSQSGRRRKGQQRV